MKHLSTPRNRKYPRSSGERTGVSLNRCSVKLTGVAARGLEDQSGGAVDPQRTETTSLEDVRKASPETVKAR